MKAGQLEFSITGTGRRRRLRVSAPEPALLASFDGTACETSFGPVLDGTLSATNAAALRAHVPALRPQPIGLRTSAGVGDRLGTATPGQARAFREYGHGIVPVFAQQSIREMDRLGRSPQEVLDDATFGLVEAGWDQPVGADADHLKSVEEIDRCLAAGFTLFTLDPGQRVRPVSLDALPQALDELPWDELEDDQEAMLRRYSRYRLDLEDGELRVSGEEIAVAAAKYGAAVAYTSSMYRHLLEKAEYPVEVEVSVDETDEVTTLAEHVFLATEMRRLGMTWVSFAPRYVGDFEKGVDYIGDRAVLHRSLQRHARIAQSIGPYKLSLHSGSDKFSIYEDAARATDRLVHLKTSGTSYLVALDVASRRAPELFREIYAVSREAYRGTRASYQVSARLERTPAPEAVVDDELPGLVAAFDSRQMLHVGYGAVLSDEGAPGDSRIGEGLREVLAEAWEPYQAALATHIGRHLGPFSLDNSTKQGGDGHDHK